MNNDNEHLVDMNKSDDNVVIVHQSSHDSNSTTDTVKKHPNIDKNKVNLNNEVIIDDDKCICPPFYHEHDDDDDHNSIVCDIVRIRKIIQLTLASVSSFIRFNQIISCFISFTKYFLVSHRVFALDFDFSFVFVLFI